MYIQFKSETELFTVNSSCHESLRAFPEEANVRACDPDTKGLKIEKAVRFCVAACSFELLEAKTEPALQYASVSDP